MDLIYKEALLQSVFLKSGMIPHLLFTCKTKFGLLDCLLLTRTNEFLL